MSRTHAAPDKDTDKTLHAKIAELRGKKHLPEQLVAMLAVVAEQQHLFSPKVAFAQEGYRLDADILQQLSPPEQRYSGVPILPGSRFPLDTQNIQELAVALFEALPDVAPNVAVDLRDLRKKLDDTPGLLQAACVEILHSRSTADAAPCLDAWAKEHPEAPHVFRFIATGAAMPSVVAVARILGQEHDPATVWPHGHCPVCGNQPLIGRLEGKEGRRMHTCSFCAFEYRAPRMGCPFCLAPEAEAAEYYHSEEEPGYLLTVCGTCNNYFKLADFREFDRPWLPLLDDLGSLTLDLYALQMGYSRPTLSGWGG